MTKEKKKKANVCFDAGKALKTMSNEDYGRLMRTFLQIAKDGCFNGMDEALDRLFHCFLEIDRILCEVEE